jgi:hypothetical protein
MAHGLALKGQYAQAEPMLSASYERMRTAFGFNDARTQRASAWLAEMESKLTAKK